MKLVPALCLLPILTCGLPAFADDLTIKVEDRVVQKDVLPFGININQAGGGSPFGIRTDKTYFSENFEGTVYRQIHEGTLHEDGFTTKYVKKDTFDKHWDRLGLAPVLEGATVTFVSGPAKGQTRTVKALEFRDLKAFVKGSEQSLPHLHMVFDKPVPLPDGKPVEGAGMLLEKDASRTEGATGWTVGHWMSDNTSLVHDDLFPGGYGHSALLLNPSAGDAASGKGKNAGGSFFVQGVGSSRFVDFNGTWIVRIKAKALDPGATLTLSDAGTAKAFEPMPVPVTDKWQEFTLKPVVSGQVMAGPSGQPRTMYPQVTATGGRVLIDDFSCTKDVAYNNPTIFTDEFVEALRALKPGIIRHLMMGGTMEERLSPWAESTRSTNSLVQPAGPVTNRSSVSWSLPEIYQLAGHLGTEVWCSIPGTLYPADVDLFMEYIGGPAGTKGGDMRIRHGHREPFTKTLRKIHVEIGNEAWNNMFGFMAGGYNGPEYWEDTFSKIKASPYFSENIVLHAAGQNYSQNMTDAILSRTPSADRYAIAPYQIHGLSKPDLDAFGSPEEFTRFCMIYPMQSCEALMPKQMEAIKKYGKQFSVYEASWHMTGDDVDAQNDKPQFPEVREAVNQFVTTVPAATAHFNHLLRLVRDFGMREVCHFTLTGQYFNVKLWGSVLNITKGSERMRPMGQVLSVVNEAMIGEMVATSHSDGEPRIRAVGGWPGNKKSAIPGKKGKDVERTPAEMPAVQSYAFRNGNQRSVILMNFDLENARKVTLQTAGKPSKTVSRLIAPKKWNDNNEYDLGDSQESVRIESPTLPESGDGFVVTLPPASIQTILWEE